jgi:hypothetical protein
MLADSKKLDRSRTGEQTESDSGVLIDAQSTSPLGGDEAGEDVDELAKGLQQGPRLEPTEAATLERLEAVDPDALTPREAMDIIYELKALLRGKHEWLEE